MPTVWGTLDSVQSDAAGDNWVQLRAVLPGGLAIRIRALIEHDTTVIRGVERVDLSSLREGEPVEVTYHNGSNGLIEAETVYVHSDDVAVSQRARD